MRADSAGREVQNLKRLSEVQHRRSSLHVVQLYDTFDHQGPNGVHQCIVLQLLGPSLGPVISKSTHAGAVLLKPPEILRLSEQVLNAVSFVHSAGFAHGGEAHSFTVDSDMTTGWAKNADFFFFPP